jgi:transcriptional regulator with XRE-family HTH domain
MQKQKPVNKQRGYFPYLSAGLIKILRQERNLTLRQIGALANTSESFVSRVARGHTSFRCEHLENIEKNLGEPIAFLQIKAMRESASEEDMELIDKGLNFLKRVDGLLEYFQKFRHSP